MEDQCSDFIVSEPIILSPAESCVRCGLPITGPVWHFNSEPYCELCAPEAR